LRTVVSVDVQPYPDDLRTRNLSKYWAVSIDEPLSENFITEQPEKIWMFGPGFWEKILDIPYGTHTIYVGVDTQPEKAWLVQVWINDKSITGGQYLPSYRGNPIQQTFDVTENAPYLTVQMATNYVVFHPYYEECRMMWPEENPEFIDATGCAPSETYYPFYINPNPGEQFAPQFWVLTNEGERAYPGSRSIFWWAFAITPMIRLRDLFPSWQPQQIYSRGTFCFPPYLNRSPPCWISEKLSPDEQGTVILGHIENDTAPPDQWVYVTDQTYTFTILNQSENCPLPPPSNPKIRITDYRFYSDAPIDVTRPGRLIILWSKVKNIGSYGIAWPFIAVKESYQPTSPVYLSTFLWLDPLRAGEEIWTLGPYVEVTPTIASQGYFTLQAGHFEPKTSGVKIAPMTPVVDEEIQIPLVQPIVTASIRSIALSSYLPPIAAKIQSLSLTSYAPQIAAKIQSLSLTSYPSPIAAKIQSLSLSSYVPPKPKYSVLTGTVYGLMGKPLSNVEITLNAAYRAVTGADGTFRIENITPATYTITAKPTKIMDKLLYKPASYEIDLTYPAEYDETINLPLNITNLTLTGTAATAAATIAYLKAKKPPPYYY